MSDQESDAEPHGFHAMEAEILLAAGRARNLKAQALLHDEGRGTASLYVVVTGQFEVVRNIAGSTRSLATIGPGQVLALMAAFDEGPCPLAIRALAESTVIEIERKALLAFFEDEREPASTIAFKLAIMTIRQLRNATRDLAAALHAALVTPSRHGRVDSAQVACIHVANYVWSLS